MSPPNEIPWASRDFNASPSFYPVHHTSSHVILHSNSKETRSLVLWFALSLHCFLNTFIICWFVIYLFLLCNPSILNTEPYRCMGQFLINLRKLFLTRVYTARVLCLSVTMTLIYFSLWNYCTFGRQGNLSELEMWRNQKLPLARF